MVWGFFTVVRRHGDVGAVGLVGLLTSANSSLVGTCTLCVDSTDLCAKTTDPFAKTTMNRTLTKN